MKEEKEEKYPTEKDWKKEERDFEKIDKIIKEKDWKKLEKSVESFGRGGKNWIEK